MTNRAAAPDKQLDRYGFLKLDHVMPAVTTATLNELAGLGYRVVMAVDSGTMLLELVDAAPATVRTAVTNEDWTVAEAEIDALRSTLESHVERNAILESTIIVLARHLLWGASEGPVMEKLTQAKRVLGDDLWKQVNAPSRR
jgi:hypothetical protein